MATGINATKEPLCCTAESIADFLQHEQTVGASADCLRQRRTHITHLYDWLPPEKLLTADALRQWRRSLEERGASAATVGNYVKNINRYLVFTGRPDLRFRQGKAKDLTGLQFGYLSCLEPTGEKHRNDLVWRCRCRCGKEVQLPATRLLTGNTSSCGCMLAEHLQRVNQYIDHTSLRAAMSQQVKSKNAASGYIGVVAKRGKWQAYITYKGIRYSLGCYTRLEDAVKARLEAKELVREDAQRLLETYRILHNHDRPKPDPGSRTTRLRRGA